LRVISPAARTTSAQPTTNSVRSGSNCTSSPAAITRSSTTVADTADTRWPVAPSRTTPTTNMIHAVQASTGPST
jgi:hypothetical protein